MLRLIRLTAEYQKQLGEMIDEWKRDQELHHTNRSPQAILWQMKMALCRSATGSSCAEIPPVTRTFLRSFFHEYVH